MLSRKECSALRGLAILGVVLHNYTHWLGMAVKENEYTYTQGNVNRLIQVISNPDWNLPIHLLSFFGHYGVPIFLFLSAYGLTMKYEKPAPGKIVKEEGILEFLWKHYKKLFVMMIVGFGTFILVDHITPGAHRYAFIDVIAQLFMFNNLMPDPDHIIWPGPYWFFGLMMQLYIIYRLFLYKRHSGIAVAIVIVCFLLQAFCAPEGDTLNRLRYNCIGGMLPFCAGLLYARMKDNGNQHPRWIYALLCVVMLAIIFGGSLDYQAWYWVPLAIIAGGIAFVKAVPEKWLYPLEWVGGISAALFVSHPIARKIIIPVSRGGDIYAGLAQYIVAAFVLAIVFKHLIKIVQSSK